MSEFETKQVRSSSSDLLRSTSPERAVPQPTYVAKQDVGNQAVQRFAQSCPLHLPSPALCPFGGICHACPVRLQAKLTISEPGDQYEKEADRVAEQVMRMPDPRVQRQVEPEEEEEEETLQAKPLAEQITPLVQRQVEPEEEEPVQAKPLAEQIAYLIQRQVDPEDEEEEEPIQAKLAEGAQVQQQKEQPEKEEPIQTKPVSDQTQRPNMSLDAQVRSLRGRGSPLTAAERSFFEPRFGRDFGHVRVHHGARAVSAARALRARAFTVGSNIVFASGQYPPGTREGRQLLAHELTHTVQQDGNQAHPLSVQRQPILIPKGYLPQVRSSVADQIASEAEKRRTNRFIRRAYSRTMPWFFSPNSGLANWASKSDVLEAARRKRRVGGATSWMKRQMIRRMPGLGRRLQNFPAGEGIVWWGRCWTCNVFVFDVLHQAGLNPPLRSNRHYFTPSEICDRTGPLRTYFSKVKAREIQKGDVFATRRHTEIVTSTLRQRTIRRGRRRVIIRSFSSIGAGKNGIGVARSTAVRPAGRQFRRVRSAVLVANIGIA